jgi:hypothetical protein
MIFTALQTFFSEETGSEYVEGLSYRAKDDDAHAKLRELLPTWVEEGKVQLGGPTAQIEGN